MRLSRGQVQNVRFSDFVRLIEAFGFHYSHTTGSHQQFAREGVKQIVNIQDERGEVKPYQAREFLGLIERYNLALEDDE